MTTSKIVKNARASHILELLPFYKTHHEDMIIPKGLFIELLRCYRRDMDVTFPKKVEVSKRLLDESLNSGCITLDTYNLRAMDIEQSVLNNIDMRGELDKFFNANHISV